MQLKLVVYKNQIDFREMLFVGFAENKFIFGIEYWSLLVKLLSE